MSPNEVIVLLNSRFSLGLQRTERPHDNLVLLTVDRSLSVEINRFVFHELQARFVVCVGTDQRQAADQFLVDYTYSLADSHLFLIIRMAVPADDLWINAITGAADIPAANWAEREIQDMLGIVLRNHPDPRRLMLADDWPQGLYPYRRDMPLQTYPAAAQAAPEMKKPPPGATVVPIGPFFPVLEEPAQFRLFVEGETVVGGDYRGFYNHRGVEKIADSQLNYNQVPFLAERICGI
jgi:Ni,Fe-hydrogenase III component G